MPTYLSRGDLAAIRAAALTGEPLTTVQALALLEEIARLSAYVETLQQELDHHGLIKRLADRRSETRAETRPIDPSDNSINIEK